MLLSSATLTLRITQFLLLNTFLLINSISLFFLALKSWIFCVPSILFSVFEFQIFVILWMLYMLVTVDQKLPEQTRLLLSHDSQVTSWKTLRKPFLMCPMKCVWSWPHDSWVTKYETFTKKAFDGLSKKEKDEKKGWHLQSFLRYRQTQEAFS